jgi:prolyl-tRNA editing enzyme YbaK/EbsC (Cys-tRNA(Pro) deacylase)
MTAMPHPKVLRALDSLGHGAATIRRHISYGENIRSPNDFAKALGYAVDRIAKTVLLADRAVARDRRLHSPVRSYGAVCLSAPDKIHLKEAARAFGWTACELASPSELKQVLDYPAGGVSPLGLGAIRLIVDEALSSFTTILIGGGEVSVEIEIAPALLIALTDATVLRASARPGIH